MKRSFLLFCAFVFFLAAPFTSPLLHGQFPPPGFRFTQPDFLGGAVTRMERAFDAADFEPTMEDAYFLGRAVAAHIFSLYRPYTQNPTLTRYLNKICQVLVINSSRPAAFRGYFVVIFDSSEFNAFASPGGHIFLSRGLVEAATTEDMLAAVIAHELAHVILEHGLEMMRAADFTGDAAEIAQRAAEFSSNAPAAQRLLGFRESVADIVDTIVRTGFSREQEFAADNKAVEILAAAGYDPQALIQMLEILEQKDGAHTGGFFATHPSPTDRIRNIEEAIRRNQPPDTSRYRRARFLNNRP